MALTLPDVSHALRDAADRAVQEHAVAIRDRSDDAPYPWRVAARGDLTALVGHLTRATTLAGRLPRPDAPTNTPRALSVDGPTVALRDALDRRRLELRPPTPSQAALGYTFARPAVSR